MVCGVLWINFILISIRIRISTSGNSGSGSDLKSKKKNYWIFFFKSYILKMVFFFSFMSLFFMCIKQKFDLIWFGSTTVSRSCDLNVQSSLTKSKWIFIWSELLIKIKRRIETLNSVHTEIIYVTFPIMIISFDENTIWVRAPNSKLSLSSISFFFLLKIFIH